MMDKETYEQSLQGRKLADKIIANCMDSSLPLNACITVLATIIIDAAIDHAYPLTDVLEGMEQMYKLRSLGTAENSEKVH